MPTAFRRCGLIRWPSFLAVSLRSTAGRAEGNATYVVPVPEAFGALLGDEGDHVDGELGGWEFSA